MNKISPLLYLTVLVGLLNMVCGPTASAQSLPNFTEVSGTQLTNTNGQWVTINPAQPNNIDLIETRIFKMPVANSGILAVEFRLEGADGGTAHYQWGAYDRFSKGGGGGQVQFTLPLQGTANHDRPFLVTFGKKGESKHINNGFYCSAGGGGSTGMSWLVPGASAGALNLDHLIAAAGGGSGGFSHAFGILNGNSAIRNTASSPGSALWSSNTYSVSPVNGTNGELSVYVVSGGSSLRSNIAGHVIPEYCCSNFDKLYAPTSLVYSKLTSATTPGPFLTQILTSVTHGQEGGKPTTVFASQNNLPNTTGLGININEEYKLRQLGGKGGAGFGGGGAGSSTTTSSDFLTDATSLPTGGAGGSGARNYPSYAHFYPSAGESGWNSYHPSFSTNATTGSRTQTENPQSGRLMYRTIMDTEPPVVVPNSFVTVDMVHKPWYLSALPLNKELLAAHIGPGKIISDNDGIQSITFHPSSVSCSEVGQTIPVPITVSDYAGNNLSTLIYVSVIDSTTPVMDGSPEPSDINVSSGPVTLTAAHFPPAKDGCNSANVIVNFPPTTFYCYDVGEKTIDFYYTDSDGNNSPVYTKTFLVVYTPVPRLYVDASATGANNGLSWEDAFTNLQDALKYGCIGSNGQEIYVARGTYYPDRGNGMILNYRNTSFDIPDNIRLYGGFPGGGGDFAFRNPEANPTILSGEIGNPATMADNSYHVVSIVGNNTHLEGFTIRNGSAVFGNIAGGGVYLNQVATSLSTDHRTTIRNCKFLNNASPGGTGGAIHANYQNTVSSNYLFIQNCAFEDNNADNGGAVYLGSQASNTNIAFVNCVFNNNTSGSQADALRVQSTVEADITNCTFGNHAGVNAVISNAGTVKMHNSILYGNNGVAIGNTGTFRVDYSNIQGSGGSGSWSLTGIQDSGSNIDTDPMFHTSPALSLLPASPCRNIGKNEYNTEIYDIYGNNYRIKQDVIDIGAFETDFVVYVAADAAPGGDGGSWESAYNNLNEGIRAAGSGVLQKDIWVKRGTYRPDRGRWNDTEPDPANRKNTFLLNFNLKIYGGFNGTENSTAQRNIGQNPTILSGDIGVPNDASDNVYHVITMQAGNARMDGLIIEGGNANASGGVDSFGGGVIEHSYYVGAVNTVANCVFRNNHADKGGAWYINASVPSNTNTTNFVQTLFYGNTATRGAATYARTSGDNNDASHNQNFYNATAFGNSSSDSGAGAFEAYHQGTPTVANIHFYNSLLAGNTPENYNDITNPGHITLTHTYAAAPAANVFVNPSIPAGADGKIMTADDGLQPGRYSPAIGYGDADWLYSSNLDKDITGNPRIVSTIDAGAYESPYNAPLVAGSDAVIYVRPVAFGEESGSSWENATSDLHNAIHAPNVQKVFVATGRYNVGAHSFIMKNGVEIYGGFDPDNGIRDLSHERIMPNPKNNSPENSELFGQFVRPVVWNIFTASTAMNNTAVLDGFMITGGKHTTGGGVRNIYASPTLRNVVINSNRALNAGAGIYNENSSPILTNVMICWNGINTLPDPVGGVPVYGGGMFNKANSNPVLTNVTIAENFICTESMATMIGPGIYNENSSPVIRNSIFWNNHKSFNITMDGVDIENSGNVNLTLQNSMTQSYDTGNPADNNIVSGNPRFAGAGIGNRDYRLTIASPAINAGDNSLFVGLNATTKDLAGNPRVFDFANNQRVDMGALEYQCLPVDYSTVTFEDITVDYDENPHSITVENLADGVAASYEITDSDDNTTVGNTATNAGRYIITATILPLVSGGDCEPVIKTAVLTINKAAAVITTDQVQSYVYDGAAKEIAASLNHTEATLTYVPQQGYTLAGVYPVTVFVPETANYLGASETVNLAIENADFTDITLEDAVFTYDGSPKSLEIAGALPSGAEALYAGNEKTDIGTYTVGALVQLPNYNDLWLSATMTITNSLPVKLISFEVRKEGKSALLEWVTVAEYDNKGFEIERSSEGRSWATIGFVPGLSENGRSNSQLAYHFTDETPVGGTNYYRLKQLDTGGRFEYSPIRSVSLDVDSEMKAWPIPVTDYVTIEFGSSYLGSRVALVNGLGMVLQELEVKEARLKFNMQKYPSGIYLIRAFDGKTLKLVK